MCARCEKMMSPYTALHIDTKQCHYHRMKQPINDEALMLAYCNGDTIAFEHLYSKHKGGVYRYFKRQCTNQAIAEELFQDVWMNIINARKRYKTSAKFTTWLYHIAHNRLIDHYRKNSRLPSSYAEEPIDEIEDNCTMDPVSEINRHRQAEKLLDCISQLPEAQRESFLLKEESGLPLIDIAEVMGTSRETIKSRLRYAIAALRRCLRGLL